MTVQEQAVSRYRSALARTDTLLASLPPLDEDDEDDDTLPGDETEIAPDPADSRFSRSPGG